MDEQTTWTDVRQAVTDLNKTLDLVQAQLNDDGEKSRTCDLFGSMFNKKK